jgi:hypothetical protein
LIMDGSLPLGIDAPQTDTIDNPLRPNTAVADDLKKTAF